MALRGTPVADFYLAHGHLVVAGIVPVFVSHRIEAVLRIGSFFDREFVAEVKRLTGAEVCLTHAQRILASTFPPLPTRDEPVAAAAESKPVQPALGEDHFAMSEAYTMTRAGTEYLVVQVRASGVDPADGFDAWLGRELHVELAPMVALTKRLAFLGALALAATFLAAWWVAARITGPVSEVVAAARELQAGNYEHPLVPSGADEVSFLARAFDEMRQALRRNVEHLRSVDRMKSNFITLAGHELKTPLTVISGFNDMLVSGLMGELPEKVQETTQLIQRRLQDLNRLVENILDMTRFEQGLNALQRIEIDLREIAADVVQKRRGNLEGRVVALELEQSARPCRVFVDADRMRQALGHLVDNAVRFTQDGGRVDVAVRQDAARARIVVRDTGVGIAPSDIDWIFERSPEMNDILHHMSGRLQFGSRGLGVGLTLCKAIVTAHGGELRVRSAVGAGSEFTIELDLASSMAGDVEPTRGRGAEAANPDAVVELTEV
jgi:signal transduction histidine kinase